METNMREIKVFDRISIVIIFLLTLLILFLWWSNRRETQQGSNIFHNVHTAPTCPHCSYVNTVRQFVIRTHWGLGIFLQWNKNKNMKFIRSTIIFNYWNYNFLFLFLAVLYSLSLIEWSRGVANYTTRFTCCNSQTTIRSL